MSEIFNTSANDEYPRQDQSSYPAATPNVRTQMKPLVDKKWLRSAPSGPFSPLVLWLLVAQWRRLGLRVLRVCLLCGHFLWFSTRRVCRLVINPLQRFRWQVLQVIFASRGKLLRLVNRNKRALCLTTWVSKTHSGKMGWIDISLTGSLRTQRNGREYWLLIGTNTHHCWSVYQQRCRSYWCTTSFLMTLISSG